MQAQLLCTVFLYDKKFITFPGGLGGFSFLLYQIQIFYCTQIF